MCFIQNSLNCQSHVKAIFTEISRIILGQLSGNCNHMESLDEIHINRTYLDISWENFCFPNTGAWEGRTWDSDVWFTTVSPLYGCACSTWRNDPSLCHVPISWTEFLSA